MRVTDRLDSASGLRPVSAFALIGCVIALVVGRVAWLAVWGSEGTPPRVRSEADRAPSWSIHDRDGRPMALFVQRLDLVLSPNAMWQAHTPDGMAERISAALGGVPSPAELLSAMLPDAEKGVVVARDPLSGRALAFTREQAQRVDAWASRGGFGDRAPGLAIDGIWLEEQRDGTWILCWSPVITLSEGMRARHMPSKRLNPLAWSRALADGLARCLLGDAALQVAPGVDVPELERQRNAIWSALMPSTYVCAVRGFDARRAPELAALLAGERVAQHQMSIERDRTRDYPGGRDPLLGFWGWLDGETAARTALIRAGFERSDVADAAGLERALASLSDPERRAHEAAYRELISAPQPLTGLERASARLLAEPRWDFLERAPAHFEYRQCRPVGELARPYFVAAEGASEAPRVVTTIDALLQDFVDDQLGRIMEHHAPAVSMAIVLDVASGSVLAVGSREAYPSGGWAPLHHQVLPGSTFKVPVMSAALESGRVRPQDVFDVGDGRAYRIPGRTISEAEQSHRQGRQTAQQCLAYSINAGLVQIGLLVPAEQLRGYLAGLHYGEAPSTGLGGERPGSLPALPWRPSWEHASVSFGYEVQVTLWQHAAALATIMRGGTWLPLRVLDAVEQGGRRYPLEQALGERVFSESTCAAVRDMMRMGAAEGTGARVASPELLPGLDVGTKTGTAQRVGSEVCIHNELAHQAEHAQAGTTCRTKACRASLRARPTPHKGHCLTLSMVAFGRRAGSEREVMVLVVVDEPTRNSRYGSDTAGPPAVAILKEALGVTALGEPRTTGWIAGFREGAQPVVESSPEPWAEVDG